MSRLTDDGLEADIASLRDGAATPQELRLALRSELPAWQAALYVDVCMHLAERSARAAAPENAS